MKTGALCIRVSTHEQDELSPDAQIRLGMEHAKKNGILIPKDFIFSESVSGRKANKRPEFQRMIALAKSKPRPFDVVIVWKFSRFARNMEESILYKSLLAKLGIEVISISEPIMDGPFGKLIERIIEWMDEYYSINLATEVTRGMTEKALRGGYQARPPLGYKIIQTGMPPNIVPEEAKIIRVIFDKYVNERVGFFDIARYLNSLGLKTSHNKSFEARSIEYIIQNPTYCGMIRWNRTTNETNEIKDKSEWIITEGQHEAIISKDLFEQAQERFKTSYKPKGSRPSSTYRHWLSGMLKCPKCGRTMIAKSITKKSDGSPYVHFACYGYCKGKCLTSNSVSSLKLEPVVITALEDVLRTQELQFSYKSIAPMEELNERQLLEQQLNQIQTKETRIKESYRNGVDTLEEYKENKEILQKERNSIMMQIQDIIDSQHVNSLISNNREKKELLKKINNVYHIITSDRFTNAKKNESIKEIVDKMVYNKEKDCLQIYYYSLR